MSTDSYGGQQVMDNIRPSAERLLEYIARYIENEDTPSRGDFFSTKEVMDVFTECYDRSIRKDMDHIEAIYREEMVMMYGFMGQFEFKDLDGFVRQVHGFVLMKKWFACIFHHINRAFVKMTGLKEPQLLQDWIDSRSSVLMDLLVRRWDDRRGSSETDEKLLQTMYWIEQLHPDFYTRLHPLYMDTTRLYYQQKREEFWSIGCDVYIRQIPRFREEDRHMDIYLQEKTRLSVQCLFVQELYYPYYVEVLYDPCHGWEAVIEQHQENLPVLIHFLREGHREIWRKCHQEYLHKKLADTHRAEDLVQIFRHQEKILAHIPDPNDFSNMIHKEFQQFLMGKPNMDYPIVRMLDISMRKREYDQIVTPLELIRLYPDQDHIHSIYRHYLGARLVDTQSIADEERVYPFFKDNFSHLLNIRTMLKEFSQNTYERGCVQVRMISKLLWMSSVSDLILPPEIAPILDAIQEEIRQERSSIRLELSTLGTVILNAQYADGKCYEFIMTPEQASVVFFLQSSRSPQSSETLSSILRLPADSECVHLLSHPRVPILVQNDRGHWRINPSFSSATRRHRIRTSMPVKKTVSITLSSSSDIPDLDHQIDAILVRLMKTHKSMSHNNLIVSTGYRTRSQNVRHIKQRIESLIEREYFCRDATDNHLYHYIP